MSTKKVYLYLIASAIIFFIIGYATKTVVEQKKELPQGTIVSETTGSLIIDNNHQQVEVTERYEENIDNNADRLRRIYSKDYSIASNGKQEGKGDWLSYSVTQSGHLGKVIIIQTTDYPLEFLRKYQPGATKPIYVLTEETKQGLSRDLYDGMAEFQFQVTNIGNKRIYYIDTFNARGCGEGEVCMDFPLDLIGTTTDLNEAIIPEPPQKVTLSSDTKNIIADDKILLSIDDDVIVDFLRNYADLCDESNINNNPERPQFCKDKAKMREMTNFQSFVLSPDRRYLVFTLQSKVLEPDTAIGIIEVARPLTQSLILTNYYLGNEFMGFSPDGNYYAYMGDCREAQCSLTVNRTKDNKLVEYVNAYTQEGDYSTIEFVEWNSNNALTIKRDGREEIIQR